MWTIFSVKSFSFHGYFASLCEYEICCMEPQSTACTQKCKTHIAMFAKNIAKVRRNRVSGLFKSGQESVLPWYDRSWLLLDICEMQLGVIVSIVCCLLYCDNETEQILLWLTWAWWHHDGPSRITQKRVWWEYWHLGVFNVVVIWLDNSISRLRLMIDSLSKSLSAFSSEFSTRIREKSNRHNICQE